MIPVIFAGPTVLYRAVSHFNSLITARLAMLITSQETIELQSLNVQHVPASKTVWDFAGQQASKSQGESVCVKLITQQPPTIRC